MHHDRGAGLDQEAGVFGSRDGNGEHRVDDRGRGRAEDVGEGRLPAVHPGAGGELLRRDLAGGDEMG